jgi:hypothetical protein
MAEKKFFVDINLQGSALTNAKIGTNTGIGSTEGAFGYDSGSHRLQYFNGTATQNVANLSDISAVTGGLIFQGGYDPTTDTPNITDGSALKGFFWAATAAGGFLGESVQVGDSIVAKVDNAGATIADWLILQGNIVIANDEVDGISRLATQTEAIDGTEAGAVVITPATLQGKIDAQITPEITNKLPLAGGTMSGTLDMANNNIAGVNSINTNQISTTSGTGYLALPGSAFSGNVKLGLNRITELDSPISENDATNKTYVDGQVATALPLTGGTMTGAIDMGGNDLSNVGTTSTLSLGTNSIENLFGNKINVITQELDLNLGKISNLTAPTNDGDATNKLYVDGAASSAQANAEATASADATAKADAAQAAAEAYADSLAPNYDAAGSAAQALTDANAYTDGKFNTNSYAKTLLVANWVAQSDYYLQDVTHNLNSNWLNISAFDLSNGALCELQVVKIDQNTSRVYVNQIPTDNIGIALSRVNPEV